MTSDVHLPGIVSYFLGVWFSVFLVYWRKSAKVTLGRNAAHTDPWVFTATSWTLTVRYQ